jgi:general stress protein CsbA
MLTALLWIVGVYLVLGALVAGFLSITTMFRDRDTGRLHEGPIVLPLLWIVVTWPAWVWYALGRMA